jgi:DNA polymerase III epsilon subunit-like protein
MDAPPTKRRKCSNCKGEGHDRRNCPSLRATTASFLAPEVATDQNAVGGGACGPTPGSAVIEATTNLPWDQVLYVLFDLETTGGSRTDDEIIEIAAMVLGPDGIFLEDGSFDALVKPTKQVTTFITSLTGITNEMVAGAPPFRWVINEFFEFVQGLCSNFSSTTSTSIEKVVFVAHNGRVFDVPFLLRSLEKHNLRHLWFNNPRFGPILDTLDIARKIFNNSPQSPSNLKLGTLFQFLTGRAMETSHRALGDVKGLYTVFRSEIFWNNRKECLQSTSVYGVVVSSAQGDSDESDEESEDEKEKAATEQVADDELGVGEEEEVEESGTIIAGDYWEVGDFIPAVIPKEKFEEVFTSTCRSGVVRTGIQVSPVMANSPLKAWRLIFTATILEKIVKYTNAYGEMHSKEWVPVGRSDVTDFIAVLFVLSIQRRKDKPSNWFSSNPLLECTLAKKITSGRQFGKMLRYLHVCDPSENGIQEDGEYNPSYKVQEFKNELEKRWTAVFVPDQELSLDETLIRAFGRIKFKVRIVSKAARFGIKLYVITDARTSFVLGVIVYTGKFTYSEAKTDSAKKTVQVVQQLCEPFRGTHRTVYVDRFYSSVDLLKELEDMQLYTTGTVMSNRIPRHISVKAKDFRTLPRGGTIHHVFNYTTKNGDKKQAGLVAWKDRKMVYCMTNDCSIGPMDQCRRRSGGGIISIPRPQVISKYNEFMGGVDLADARRLHCNSTVMGQNRWWLKLFFYLLDAGTSNALVIYNEAMKGKQKPFNIADFKAKLVEGLVGAKLKDSLDSTPNKEHTMIPIPSGERQRCSYCAVTGSNCRTRYMCEACGIPYCSIGSGKTARDCYALAHESDQVRQICINTYERNQTSTRKEILKRR